MQRSSLYQKPSSMWGGARTAKGMITLYRGSAGFEYRVDSGWRADSDDVNQGSYGGTKLPNYIKVYNLRDQYFSWLLGKCPGYFPITKNINQMKSILYMNFRDFFWHNLFCLNQHFVLSIKHSILQSWTSKADNK